MKTRTLTKYGIPCAQVAALVRPSFHEANPRQGSVPAHMHTHEGHQHRMLWAKMTDTVEGAPPVACFEVEGTTWFGYVPTQVRSARISLVGASFELVSDGAGTFRVELTHPSVNWNCDNPAYSGFAVMHSPPRTEHAA